MAKLTQKLNNIGKYDKYVICYFETSCHFETAGAITACARILYTLNHSI